MSKLQVVEVASAKDATRALDLPEQIRLSLGEIVGDAREGLLALSVRVGLAVLRETMEWEVDRVVGPKGRHDQGRVAKRHGHTKGEVTLGGRRVSVSRPRVRSVDDAREIGLDSYREFTSRDPLSAVVAERILAGVSTRQYRRTQEPVGSEVEDECRSTSKSAVSREFVRRARTALQELLARRLDRLELVALMIDGIELDERCHVVALGIKIDGTKVPLGLWEGSTENATVVTALLADMQERGLGFDQPILCVIDGAKALAKAIRAVIGNHTPIQRCVVHKARNVCDHLPQEQRPWVRAKLATAWAEEDHAKALASLQALARALEHQHPTAAASLREGMQETLTVTRLGISGRLKRTLQSTNTIENLFSRVRRTQLNVKRWHDGDMRQRWTAAAILDAERNFRRIKGKHQLARLAAALGRELGHPRTQDTDIVNAA
ncbi:MAG: IS256 family transposase [Solirubrobacteraceae bacterium]